MLMPSSSRRAKEVYTRAARGEQPPAGSRAVVKPWDRARGGGYRAWVMPGPQVQSQTGRPCSGVIDDSMVMGCQQQEGLQGCRDVDPESRLLPEMEFSPAVARSVVGGRVLLQLPSRCGQGGGGCSFSVCKPQPSTGRLAFVPPMLRNAAQMRDVVLQASLL